jgi:hypothetical protein
MPQGIRRIMTCIAQGVFAGRSFEVVFDHHDCQRLDCNRQLPSQGDLCLGVVTEKLFGWPLVLNRLTLKLAIW